VNLRHATDADLGNEILRRREMRENPTPQDKPMPLSPDEARASFDRLAADLARVQRALKPDEDGKVRVTAAEARAILRSLPGNVLALVVDIID
jgi:hypothetical protein